MTNLKSFERFFSEAAAAAATEQEEDIELHQLKRQRIDEEDIRRLKTPLTANDAIKRILLADKDKDYFRMLELPYPEVDALGKPQWGVTPAEISKAYRKLSVLVHPDKNPGDDARQAFEVLNQAHRKLKDSGEVETILKKHLEMAKLRKEEAEARATLEERVAMNAQLKQQVKQLRRQEGESLHNEIVRQMLEKQERAKKRKDSIATSRYRRIAAGDGDEEERKDAGNGFDKGIAARDTGKEDEKDGDEEDEAGQKMRQALARRKTQKKRSTL